ncbi:MAG: hypothetical protein AB1449_15225 [Chloroflexota bacterium]
MDFFRTDGALIDAHNLLVDQQEQSPGSPYDRARTQQLAAQAGDLWELAQQLPRPAPARDAADDILQYAAKVSTAMDALADYAATGHADALDAYTSAIQEAAQLRARATDALADLDADYHNVLATLRCQ